MIAPPMARYQAWLREWAPGEGVVHLLPQHWNWRPGEAVEVWAYSNGAAVELFLNNVSLGRKVGLYQSDCHFAVALNQFVTGPLSYSVTSP